MSISGPSNHGQSLFMVLVDELHKLTLKISDEELSRAKNILKMNILMAMERKEDRLEEMARNYMTYNDLTFFNYLEKIDAVTSEKINKAASQLFKGKPTIIINSD